MPKTFLFLITLNNNYFRTHLSHYPDCILTGFPPEYGEFEMDND
jgi:hypothetical protein